MKELTLTLNLTLSKDIPNLEDFVTGRIYILDGVEDVTIAPTPPSANVNIAKELATLQQQVLNLNVVIANILTQLH